ncbi:MULTISPECIES: type II secretion system protein GspL [unclassified Variovorax]|uniref:type II secretion system protein GspL n=1 Tax=unclassified Variovorax TaxID=663243 RepID=UPI0008B53C67|nr:MULTISPECIES: type II secretion system protein GspL [unclassified Variovorax]SEK14797.1 general secretion pathway protein L [Variovorax sp. OK202]SFE04032.1 general secretion pathway protein L [Variovorax sp. OK212]
MKAGLLRLQLPPWPGRADAHVALRCGWRLPDGTWGDGGMLALGDVARKFRAKRLEACLHPGDVPMAAFTLPPLAGRRLRAAVQGAIEPCALQPLDRLVTAFGPRAEDGTVPAAWAARDAVSGWQALLRAHGLPVRALHLPAAFLPCVPEGAAACRIDQWLVVRTGKDHGFVQWLPEGAAPPAALRLIEDGAAERWCGEGWSWSLPTSEAGGVLSGAHSTVPVGALLGWGALAMAVGLAGLNLHAKQLATQGQALKRQMAARVKAAFPEVPVVVDPVRQAKQQKEALAAGAVPAAAGLLRAGANLLAQAQAQAQVQVQVPAGQVQGLRYTAGELHIRWRDGGAPAADERRALQARAAEQGLAVQADAQGLRVSIAAVNAADAVDAAKVRKADDVKGTP